MHDSRIERDRYEQNECPHFDDLGDNAPSFDEGCFGYVITVFVESEIVGFDRSAGK